MSINALPPIMANNPAFERLIKTQIDTIQQRADELERARTEYAAFDRILTGLPGGIPHAPRMLHVYPLYGTQAGLHFGSHVKGVGDTFTLAQLRDLLAILTPLPAVAIEETSAAWKIWSLDYLGKPLQHGEHRLGPSAKVTPILPVWWKLDLQHGSDLTVEWNTAIGGGGRGGIIRVTVAMGGAFTHANLVIRTGREMRGGQIYRDSQVGASIDDGWRPHLQKLWHSPNMSAGSWVVCWPHRQDAEILAAPMYRI